MAGNVKRLLTRLRRKVNRCSLNHNGLLLLGKETWEQQ